jgi:uncharacterized protein (TIGR00255 family)
MIFSMTAFSRCDTQGDFGTLVCEMRSVNHRYLEVYLQLPDLMRTLEMQIRDRIRQTIKRGKVECQVRYQPGKGAAGFSFTVNMQLAEGLSRASEQIASLLIDANPLSISDVLTYPGVLVTKEADVGALQKEMLQLLDKSLADLRSVRSREGSELKQLFMGRMDLMKQELEKVKERLPSVLRDQQDRLLKRFADAKLDLDTVRLEQEMVFFAQKIDVTEEIERLETHISEVSRVLEEGGTVGRRLDFLLQELNREANTLGSKSVDPTVTHAALEMKVLIEQVREQVQNIE